MFRIEHLPSHQHISSSKALFLSPRLGAPPLAQVNRERLQYITSNNMDGAFRPPTCPRTHECFCLESIAKTKDPLEVWRSFSHFKGCHQHSIEFQLNQNEAIARLCVCVLPAKTGGIFSLWISLRPERSAIYQDLKLKTLLADIFGLTG